MNIRTLADGRKDDDPKKKKTTNSFAGGEKSGLAVENPEDEDAWSRAERISGPAPPGSRRVTIYSNGFTIDDSDFRPLDDPVNKRFLDDLQKGVAPKELAGGNSPVHVTVEDKRSETYNPPAAPQQSTLFSGQGMALSSAPSSTAAADVDVSRSQLELDPSKPTTTLAVRFHNGRRVRQQFNQTHTVADLHEFVMLCAPVDGEYRLLAGFPPKEITAGPSTTLKDAGLLNESVTQALG